MNEREEAAHAARPAPASEPGARILLVEDTALNRQLVCLQLAARGYGISMGDLLMVAEDVAQNRLSLPFRTAVASGENYYLVWPKTRPGGERLKRLSDFLQHEVAAMELPVVKRMV